jgi:cytochrome b6-f complex iron-sulfur subunit
VQTTACYDRRGERGQKAGGQALARSLLCQGGVDLCQLWAHLDLTEERRRYDGLKSRALVPITGAKVDYGEKLLKATISRKTFVRLGALLGVGTAGASVLAACQGSSGSGGSNARSGGGSGENAANGGPSGPSDKDVVSRAEEQASVRRVIARVSEVRPGTAVKFEDSRGNAAVLVHLRSGNFVAYSAVCPHQGCIVAYKNGQLACPCHGSIFDPANNARVVMGPAQRPLLKIPVEVRGGEVVRA